MAEKLVKTSVSLPPKLWRAVRMEALRDGVDASDLLADALRLVLQRRGAAKKGR
jgi:hypothetical protein